MFVDTQVRPQGEQVDVVAPSKMKLSAAIRIGAKIRPQCTGVFWTEGKSCALGAALEAVGTGYGKDCEFGALIQRHFPNIIGHVGIEVLRRNDAGQSRESIADWLEARGL